MLYILNAFSLNMLDPSFVEGDVHVKRISLVDAQDVAHLDSEKPISGVGHADTARLFSQQLGVDVPANRITVTLKTGDRAMVGQYVGPRLPEGATQLPEGARIDWFTLVVG